MRKVLFGLALLTLTACHSVRRVPGPDLGKGNFKIVKAGAVSTQSGFKLFGLFPIVTPSLAKADAELYAQAGNVEGRTVLLANKVEERTGFWLVLFSIPKLTVTADVVELKE